MPFAPAIRKEILQALEDRIIPALWKQQVSLGYVSPPFRFSPDISKRIISHKVPRPDAEQPGFPVHTSWGKAKLLSTYHPYLSFIYDGTADERTVVTAAQANQFEITKGIYALRWQAPGVLLFPPGTPRNAGGTSFWEDSQTHPSSIKILQLGLREEMLVHTASEDALQAQAVSHSLQIKEEALHNLANLFCEELHHAPGRQDTAQALLLALMLRLRDHLLLNPGRIANTAHPFVAPAKSFKERHYNTWKNAVDFIQMHLHEQLSVSLIAKKTGISPANLNNLFHQFSGTSVMHYVRQQRIAAAKVILEKQPERIKEIAALLNFKSSAAFCSVFRRETGLTPNQFRRQALR